MALNVAETNVPLYSMAAVAPVLLAVPVMLTVFVVLLDISPLCTKTGPEARRTPLPLISKLSKISIT